MKYSPCRPFYLQLSAMLCLGLAFFLGACESTNLSEIKELANFTELPTVTARNIELTYTDSGQIAMKSFSPELQAFNAGDEPYILFPKGAKATFYKNGKPDSHLSSNWAKYYKGRKLWEAKYRVTMINEKKDTLRTEHLFCDETREVIYTEKFVQITDAQGWVISGENGFESNIDFTEYEFKKVRGRFYLGEEY